MGDVLAGSRGRTGWVAAVLLILAASLATAAQVAPPPSPGRRVALVIGVSAYRHVPALPNPVRDGRGMAAALTRLGFAVDLVLDPDRAALEDAVRRLGQRAKGADAAAVFYAGHALEVGGRNWLLPVGTNPMTERDLRFEALELDGVLEQLDGAARVSIVLLDSCRDNPFRIRFVSGSRGAAPAGGLAPPRGAVGMLIAFATAPGSIAQDGAGENSPFTTALLRRIETPGQEVRALMAEVRRDVREATGGQQVPWEHSALEGEFFFKPAARVAAPPAPSPPRAPIPPPQMTRSAGDSEAEVLFWQSVRESGDPADLRAYLARYPAGTFADLARNRLARLGGAAPSPPADRAGAPDAPPAGPVSSAPDPSVVAKLTAALPPLSAAQRAMVERLLRTYAAEPSRRAFALALPEGRTFRRIGFARADEVRTAVLESCQAAYRQPCVLFAEDDEPRTPPAGRVLVPEDMPRVRYSGQYDPAMIPALSRTRRAAPDVTGYGQAPAPKAMAFHPVGRVFAASAAPTQQEAEAEALRQCNADPDRHGRDGRCLLYAAGDQVVLPQLRTAPATPATPPPRPNRRSLDSAEGR